ncbi:hypothetical protein KIPB_007562, partial [Kipferlia bialata]
FLTPSPLGPDGHRTDTQQRPELCHQAYEIEPPAEYMSRPPMPQTVLFLMDVSPQAQASGLLNASVKAVKAALAKLATYPRVLVSLICFDTSVHFFRLPANGLPERISVPSIDDVFVPYPRDLVVNIQHGKAKIETILNDVHSLFSPQHPPGPPMSKTTRTQSGSDVCFGAACLAACKALNNLGGRVMYFLSSMPSAGPGSVHGQATAREQAAGIGDTRLGLDCGSTFLRDLSVEAASKAIVCMDGFVCPSGYVDMASLAVLSRTTAGHVELYPTFVASRDGERLVSDVLRSITRETALEALMRLRVSKGLRIDGYSGHYFLRHTDLLCMSQCDADSAVGVNLVLDDSLAAQKYAFVQGSILYTTQSSERRVRVVTIPLPVSKDALALFHKVDTETTIALIAKNSTLSIRAEKAENIRRNLTTTVQQTLAAYKTLSHAGSLPPALRLMPLLSLALLKSTLLRPQSRADERALCMCDLASATVPGIRNLLHPACYQIPLNPTTPTEEEEWRVPETVRLSSRAIDGSRAYVIGGRFSILVWLGAAMPEEAKRELVHESQAHTLSIRSDTPMGKETMRIIEHVRGLCNSSLPFFAVSASGQLHRLFMLRLVEDAVNGEGYEEWLRCIQGLQ